MLKNIFFCCYLLLSNQLLLNVDSIKDDEYEQVIADRYLFSRYSNESSWWPVLDEIDKAWQVVSLPEYHVQSTNTVWLLVEKSNVTLFYPSYAMYLMSISNKTNFTVLPKINIKTNSTYLVASHNRYVSSKYTAALISPDDIRLIFCDQFDATSCEVKRAISFLCSSSGENTREISSAVFIEDMEWLYIATNNGLHSLDLVTFQINCNVNQLNISVSSLAWSPKYQTIFIGTETKLWIQTYQNRTNKWRFEHIDGLIDDPISSLVYSNVQNKLWIGQNIGITLLSPVSIKSTGRIHWYFTRLSGHVSSPGSDVGYLPMANITCLSVSNSKLGDSFIWLGSVYGLMRFDSNQSANDGWRVFNSGRYLPNRDSQVNISSLTVLNRNKNISMNIGSTVVSVTNRGLTIIRFESWTLERKASHFQKMIDESNRHVRYNLVSDCTMSKWGDPTTCVKGPNDNDGLWTSMYLSSQVFRYALTNDTNVREKAWSIFQGLYFLNQVTDISGYPARSWGKMDEIPPSPDWHPSPLNLNLTFKGDTSSDEIVGHEYVYPLVYDLLCQTDDERKQAYDLLLNITTHILTHNWYLIGENRTHTTWGIWNPKEINNDSFYQETRGLNSLQVLSFLFQAYRLTSDDKFLNGIYELIDSYDYDINLINQKIIAVCDENFSDDELAYLSYFNLVYAFDQIRSSTKFNRNGNEHIELLIQRIEEHMLVGLELSHQYKQMEKSPFYNFIYCYSVSKSKRRISLSLDCKSLVKDSIWFLQRYPLELIDWPQYNSDRLDVYRNHPASCSSPQKFSLNLLSPDETSIHKWNGGPFGLDGGDGFTEDDPTIFLLSYWGMKYFNLLDV